ncbi:hypothetical protein CIB95_12680 [Lottiidibacillus patelloidae]|uniref:Uncharacterized protein n=1 Tax=Lottiidibacillus patelloidae TaxID=2670334 RepID=A0A263BRD9_9BACI|nr:hypothetical protein [Lottiidibacillus patelloidae]OZM56273.1 hypothetical protein CIB95_12680 [Lottiidibacillus patelloidae]
MKLSKLILFAFGNVAIGLISVYIYFYLWIMFSFGGSFQLFSIEALVTMLIFILLFILFNLLILKNETNKNWWIASSLALTSILTFILVMEFS